MKGLADNNQTTEEKYENDRITTIIGESLIFNPEFCTFVAALTKCIQ